MLSITVLVIEVLTSLFLVLLVLAHSGKGGGLSEMLGGAGGLSGGTSMERTLDRITVITAILWFICTMWLSKYWV